MTGFRPGIDIIAPNTVTSNDVLFARRDAYDRAHGTGAYSPKETRTGPEQAADNHLLNLRLQLSQAEKNLEGFANRHRDSKSSYRAYLNCHARVRGLMEQVAAITGETFRFHVPLSDPFATNIDWIGAS